MFLPRHFDRNKAKLSKVNLALTLNKSRSDGVIVHNKIVHVTIFCKQIPLTRHLDRSVAKRNVVERSHTIICLQIIVSPVNDLEVKQLDKIIV